MDVEQLAALDPGDALSSIIDHWCEFNSMLEGRKTDTQILMLLPILADVVSLDTNVSDVIRVLTAVNTEAFFDKISGILGKVDKSKAGQCPKSIIQIVSRIFLRMPSAAIRSLGILKTIQEHLKRVIDRTSSDYYESLQTLHDEAEKLTENIIHNAVQTKRVKFQSKSDNREPPDDFRQIPVLPRTDDIFIPGNEKPFLRKNIDTGAYENLDHYLDVQFRLFREDCLSQLRSGIMEYINQKEINGEKKIKRLQNARLYRKAQIVETELTLEGKLYTIQLDKKHAKEIKWDRTNRLMYGSLLCLSPDDFQTLYFGVIVHSDRETLTEKHTFKVELSQEEDMLPIKIKVPVTIVETTTHFEAYRHVLRCLQRIKPGELPFERYIVDCKTDVLKPSYLLRRNTCFYDFYPNMRDKNIFERPEQIPSIPPKNGQGMHKESEKYTFNIDNDEWPSAQDLYLDASQYKAFKAALSNEFALIQGPPGTGKTHLGLQIAKALLRNRRFWINDDNLRNIQNPRRFLLAGQRRYPMLVVCHTNHALDQFMEGIIKFMDIDPDVARTATVVRVGGRCENELVKKFSLRNFRVEQGRFVNYRMHKEEMESAYYTLLRYRHLNHEREGVIFNVGLLNMAVPKKKQVFEKDEELLEWLDISDKAWMDSIRHLLLENKEKDEGSTALEPIQEVPKENLSDESDVDIETEDQKARSDWQIEGEEFTNLSTLKHETLWMPIEDFRDSFLSEHVHELGDQAKIETENLSDLFIKELSKQDKMTYDEAIIAMNMLKERKPLPRKDRWKLYRYWAAESKTHLQQLLLQAEETYAAVFERYNREKQRVDKEILYQASVIAMTTTGASRYQEVLKEVSPRIVIVEEAAEVLEAHIIASLNPHCEHLILIGDHKQLEPKSAVWELALKYKLSLSMFERMVKNGLCYNVLQCQHRMRPEISQLVRPVYEHIIDNDNVHQYPNVNGILQNVVFFKHHFPEECNDERKSSRNLFEALYAKRLG